MFQLIVAVVSILLIAVMVVAAIWYGGEVYAEASSRRHYIEYTNAALSIDTALRLYGEDWGPQLPARDTALLNQLVGGKYLKSVPQGNWIVDETQLRRPIDSVATCEAINKADGKDLSIATCPSCLDPEFINWKGCIIPPAVTP